MKCPLGMQHKNPLRGDSIILGLLELRHPRPRGEVYIKCPYGCGCFVKVIIDGVKIWENHPDIIDVSYMYGRYHGHFYEGTEVRVPFTYPPNWKEFE